MRYGFHKFQTALILLGLLAPGICAAQQKIVLQKIQMLNEVTNNFISSNAQMLKDQGVEIQRQSMQTNITVETLKTAFADVMEALDSISTYKQEALPKMRVTINQFKELAAEGEEQIRRLENGHKQGL